MPKKKQSKPTEPEPPLNLSFETYWKIDGWRKNDMTKSEPDCYNGMVFVKRYRITCQEIEEPKEVIVARIQKLWNETKNNHDWEPLKRVAAQYGVELKHSYHA